MRTKDALELLGQVQPVDPPPFLYTRDQARLDERAVAVAPRSWVTVAVALAALLLVLNIAAVRGSLHGRSSDAAQPIASELGLSASNQLYQ